MDSERTKLEAETAEKEMLLKAEIEKRELLLALLEQNAGIHSFAFLTPCCVSSNLTPFSWLLRCSAVLHADVAVGVTTLVSASQSDPASTRNPDLLYHNIGIEIAQP